MTSWPAGARAFVEAARVARLATADRTSRPHVIPICFVLSGDDLFSVVDAKPKRRPTSMKRLRNLIENPQASVLVDRWDEDWSRLAWVMLQGRAEVVADAASYSAALGALRAKYVQYAKATFRIDANPMIRLAVEHVVTWSATPAP
jgi:PPOX class probable F420-dependent enzyme